MYVTLCNGNVNLGEISWSHNSESKIEAQVLKRGKVFSANIDTKQEEAF